MCRNVVQEMVKRAGSGGGGCTVRTLFHGSRRSLTTCSPFVSIVVLLRPIPSLLISALHAISLCPCLYPSSVFFLISHRQRKLRIWHLPARTLDVRHFCGSRRWNELLDRQPRLDSNPALLVFPLNSIFNRHSTNRVGNQSLYDYLCQKATTTPKFDIPLACTEI